MIAYFADRRMKILGLASTSLPAKYSFSDDKKTVDVDTGVAIFEGSIVYQAEDRTAAEAMTMPGNSILRRNGDEYECYIIIDAEVNEEQQEIYFYAEDAGLDLLNEEVSEFSADKAYSAAWYVKKFAAGSGFEVGTNEVSKLTRKLSWEGTSTATERLRSVATQFNAELTYSFRIDGFEIKHRYINILRTTGKDRGTELRIGRDISNITIKKSIENLVTALRATGGKPEKSDKPITLKGYSYDDGDFYVSNGLVCSRKILKTWKRYVGGSGAGSLGHVVKNYSYDTLSQATLCSKTISKLKQVGKMEVNYDVELVGIRNVRLGDRIRIVDYDGKLYLSARALKIVTSVVNDSMELTLGDYIIKSPGISEKILELAEQVRSARKNFTWIVYAKDASGTEISTDPTGMEYVGITSNQSEADPDLSDPSVYTWSKIQGNDGKDAVLLRIDSSRGTVFKNNAVSTVLSVVIFKGGQRMTTIDSVRAVFGNNAYIQWSWQRMDESTFGIISADDSRIIDGGMSFVLSPEDVDTKVTFQCDLITD